MTGELGQHMGNAFAHLMAVQDHVDGTVLKQELAALEAFRQFLTHGLLNHSRTRETNQGIRLCNIEIPSIAKLAETPPKTGSVITEM